MKVCSISEHYCLPIIQPLLVPICDCPSIDHEGTSVHVQAERVRQFATWSTPILINDTSFVHKLAPCMLLQSPESHCTSSLSYGALFWSTLLFWATLCISVYLAYWRPLQRKQGLVRIESKM